MNQKKDYDFIDENKYRYIGLDNNYDFNKMYYSTKTIKLISEKVSELLDGVDHMKRKIIIPDKTISHVMSSVHNNYKPNVGDIHSRYIISSRNYNMFQNMIDRTIEIIVSDVKNHELTRQNNEKLTIWTTVLGEHNEHGLRSHDIIKIRNKHPHRMAFFENY